MKKLIISSESASEDAKAAVVISQHMKAGDCGQVIWYSDLGRRMAQFEKRMDKMAEMHTVCDSIKERQYSMGVDIYDLKSLTGELKAIMRKVQKEMEDLANEVETNCVKKESDDE